jgi:hypothetical protein
MPYLVNHQPNPLVLSAAANAIGQEEFFLREREFAAREQQRLAALAQRDQQLALERDRLVAGQEPAAEALNRRGPRFFNTDIGKQQQAMQNRVLEFLAGDQEFGQRQALQNDRFGQQMALQNNRFGFEGERQDALLEREQQVQQSTLERQRQAQLARQLDAEWQAILEHRGELTDEEFQDVQGQLVDKYQALGQPPPIQFPGGQQKSEGEARLEEFKGRYPKLPWRMGKDGEPELPRGFQLEMDEDYRKEQMQHEIEKTERTEAVKIRVQQESAAIKEQQETTKREAANLATYTAQVGKAIADAQKMFVKKDPSGLKADGFDKDKADEFIRQMEATFAAGLQIPPEKRISADGSGPQASAGTNEPIPVTSPDEIRTKVKIGGKYTVNGVVFTRTR